MGLQNIHVRIGDGYAGWPENGPFHRVVITAAPAGVPEALFAQLGPDGVLVAPVGTLFDQTLVRYRRRGSEIEAEELGPVRFVPMLAGTT